MNKKEFLEQLGLSLPKTSEGAGRLDVFLMEVSRSIPYIEAHAFRLSIGLGEKDYSREQVAELLGFTPARMLEVEAKILARFRTPERLELLRAVLSA